MNRLFKFETSFENVATESNIMKSGNEIEISTFKRNSVPKLKVDYKILMSENHIDFNDEESIITHGKPLFDNSGNGKNIKSYFVKPDIYPNKDSEHFLSLLKNDTIETGYYSNSQLFLKNIIKDNPLLAKNWLNTLFYNNLSDSQMLIKLLYIISDIEYDLMKPEGPIIAMAAASHKDLEVQEYSIRVFEKWANIESLEVLKNITFSQGWLQEYANEVINDLTEELL